MLETGKTIAIAADHAGFELKTALIGFLKDLGFTVKDFGTYSADSVDYPDFAHVLAESVGSGNYEQGVLICGSANGVSMAANKHKGVRCAICWNEEVTSLSRAHNDANIAAFPARFIDENLAKKCLELFLATPFEGGRHANRVGKINC